MFTNPNLIYYDGFVFCSIPRLFVRLRMRMSTSKQYANVYVNQYLYVRGLLRECRSIQSGAPGLPYYCASFVCVSEVIELLAVCSITNQKPKPGSFAPMDQIHEKHKFINKIRITLIHNEIYKETHKHN